ncbi:1,2-dihydroxy-3-keto-5-methylthiopentene dioxygenase [Dispira simplex]|nr:1,2-dihydroxy-3-keto-5-methylthiopentene dioxygenase [Dispira simplex]
MRAYLYNDQAPEIDPREPHEFQPSVPVTQEELTQFGVLYWSCLGPNGLKQMEAVAKERHYKNRDEITISPDRLPNFEEKIKTFFTEHIHEDEEIRFILAGSGYFDVRDPQDRWVRIHVVGGDLIVLPAGIYHRFTLDTNKFIHTMRLFKDEPKWEAINRPLADTVPCRTEYLHKFQSIS